MPDERQRPSFWETIPGIITAIATLIGAVAALITALYTAKLIGHDSGQVAAKSTQEATVRGVGPGKSIEAAPAALSRVISQPVSSVPKQGDIMTDPVIGIEFVYVPKGCFQMGSQPDEEDRDNDEGPVHKVCVDGFWMGKYEVTQGQWQKIMGSNPAYFKKGDNYPVESVSWDDAQKFITKLNKKSGENYRLPTEAEWEYAARARSPYKYSGENDLDAVAWHFKNSSYSTHPVGGKQANDFGLYDMSGNVWEWCADWYDSEYYSSSPQNNPTGPDTGTYRVLRGGSWLITPRFARCSVRFRFIPDLQNDNIGFRAVFSQADF